MILTSRKEARVLSEKYMYENLNEYYKHKEEMAKRGFREVHFKYAPLRAAYQKFTGIY